MGAEYITKEDLKQSLELTGTRFADRDLERAIAAASDVIGDITNRRFDQDATDTTRYFTRKTSSLCLIDDVMLPADGTPPDPLVTVSIDVGGDSSYSEAWVEDTDYHLEPRNALVHDKPYEVIRARRTFPKHAGAIRVVGRFGWAAIPSQVVEACVIIASQYVIRARVAPMGILVAGVDSGVAMRIATFDPQVMALLEEVTKEVLA